MLRKTHFDFGDMALALVAILVVVPFLGWKVAAIAAVVLFFMAMAICWGVCGWKIYKNGL